MAIFPTFESILLEVHQSLAPHGGVILQSVQKARFAQLDKELHGHLALGSALLNDIFQELGFDGAATRDALHNIIESSGFHTQLELETWTYDADTRQIAWYMLGYTVVPEMGRRLAFWSMSGGTQIGMPHGGFWFLPQEARDGEKNSLSMPVTHVMDWLNDLLGQTTYAIADESFRKNLYNWRKGDLPDNKSIGAYFADCVDLDFQGCFTDDVQMSEDDRFASALSFVARKNLDADKLRAELAMPQAGAIESILGNTATMPVKLHFVELLAARYARPTMQTIRQRLYTARMFQDGYERLVRFLCPGIDKRCSDPLQNKVLQLIWLFEYTYRLTIEAERHGKGHGSTDAWFEQQLPEWLAHELFLAILPSCRHKGASELGYKLSSRFSQMNGGEKLEDLFLPHAPLNLSIIERNTHRLRQEASEALACMQLNERIRAGSPFRALQASSSQQAVSSVAHNPEVPPRVRLMALERLRQLPQNPYWSIDAVLAELHLYLNNDRKRRPDDCEARVVQLISIAQATPAAEAFKAVILQYQAKHRLAMNDFDGAAALFKGAFDACLERSYGPMRGEIARDAFALAVAKRPLQRADERFYRSALFFGQIEGANPSFEDAAAAMAEYFWEDLYLPYPGYEIELAPLKSQCDSLVAEPLSLFGKNDGQDITAWMTRNSNLKNKRLRDVRGDTVVTLWMKMLHEFERSLPRLKQLFRDAEQAKRKRPEEVCACWRQAIGIVATKWRGLLDMSDFKGQTALMLAADYGDVELLQSLLEAGANPDRQDFLGRTAVHAAVAAHCWRAVQLLLGAEPDLTLAAGAEKNSVLHTAVRMGSPRIVSGILAHSQALKEIKNAMGETPAMLAERIVNDLPAHALRFKREGRTTGSAADYAEISKLLAAHG